MVGTDVRTCRLKVAVDEGDCGLATCRCLGRGDVVNASVWTLVSAGGPGRCHGTRTELDQGDPGIWGRDSLIICTCPSTRSDRVPFRMLHLIAMSGFQEPPGGRYASPVNSVLFPSGKAP